MDRIFNNILYYTTRVKTKYIRDFYLAKNGLERTVRRFPKYGDRLFSTPELVHAEIASAIDKGTPYMVGRFGSVELQVTIEEYLGIKKKIDSRNRLLSNNAGFFPADEENTFHFSEVMLDAMSLSDIQGVWYLCYEDYAIKRLLPCSTKILEARYLEPWFNTKEPWTKSLQGKKVVVVHPFVNTIEMQYEKRKLIFPQNPEFLPEFELKTVRAVQTAAGAVDSRFDTWFDALDYMYAEVMKHDFDVAIIGCGAYGYPLAAMLKRAGKQAIHLGGVVQAMFGIKGKRWLDDPNPIIRNLYNEHWVFPNNDETPVAAKTVEGGCYW